MKRKVPGEAPLNRDKFEIKLLSCMSERALAIFCAKAQYSIPNISSFDYAEKENSIIVTGSCESFSLSETTEIIRELEAECSGLENIPKRIIKNNITFGGAKSLPNTIIEESRLDLVTNSSFADVSAAVSRLFWKNFSEYSKKLRAYPSLIQRDTLSRCGYLSKFPQNTYFVYEHVHDRAALMSLRTGGVPCDSGALLAPATCFHCYEELAGTMVPDGDTTCAVSRCFRHEVGWRVGGFRMREFDLMEVIYVGSADKVASIRSELIEMVWTIFQKLELRGAIETAYDPFYFAEHDNFAQFQLVASSKYELVCDTGRNNFAVGSFNIVGTNLCAEFDITCSSGSVANSGCTGMGIERWAYALLETHGDSIGHWPAEVRNVLGI